MWTALLACRPPETSAAPAPRSDALVFVMVDRFADGTPDPPGAVDRTDPAAWHGGDLRGLIDRLDTLADLGVGGVWLSPLADAREAPIDGWGAFHGYWTEDPAALEPRFGTEAEVVELREALDARGLQLWLDVVWNHVAYDAPVTLEHPGWLHGRGPITDWSDPVQVVDHDVHGLPDLAQEDPEVHAWLLAATRRWLELARPDGLRVDAVRHLEPGFVRALGDELRADRPGLRLLGEVFDGDGGVVAERARREGLDEVFDFPSHYPLVQATCGDRSLVDLPGTLAPTLGGAVPVTLLDNHDLPRIASVCGVDGAARALAVLATLRGRPSLAWGTEHAALGEADPDNRADQRFDGPAPLAPTLKALLALRAELPWLADAPTRTLLVTDRTWVFRRDGPGATLVGAVHLDGAALTLPATGLDGRPSRTWTVTGAGPPLQGGSDVPPRSVWLGLWDTPAPATPPVEVRLVVRDAPPGELRWVGGIAGFPGWTPELGRATVDGVARFTVPEGTVLVGKPVVLDGSEVRWDPGPDRVLLATARDDAGPFAGLSKEVVWSR